MTAVARYAHRSFVSRRKGGVFACLILGGVASGMFTEAAEPDSDPEVKRFMEALRAGTLTVRDGAILGLAQLGERAIAALADGLEDSTIQSACADTLSRMPPHIAIPPLRIAIDRAPVSDSRERLWKANLIAALGALRSSETVPYLEDLYDREDDKLDHVALSAAWALRHVTGREYGPAHNPWEACRQYVKPSP